MEGLETSPVPTEEISGRQLKLGYWFVAHKIFLSKLGIGFLIAVIAGSFIFALYSLIKFYAFEQNDYNLSTSGLAQDYVNVVGVHEYNQILPLEIVERYLLVQSNGKIDLVARVRNPNNKWALKNLSYRFSLGGQIYDSQTSFFLPGEEKYLSTLNVNGSVSGTPQLIIDGQAWRRVTAYETWAPERLQFLVTEKQFKASSQSELSDQINISEASANITNRTAYNYHNIEVQVALLSGTRLAALALVNLQDFLSGERRPLVARFSQSLPPITQVEILPSVNIIDAGVYKDFVGEFDPSILELPNRGF